MKKKILKGKAKFGTALRLERELREGGRMYINDSGTVEVEEEKEEEEEEV